jgi:hypothetical protein
MIAVGLAVTSQVSAKVDEASATGFVVSLEAQMPEPPSAAYARFVDIGSWWSADHTFSGSSANMTLSAAQGGCWCESLPDGGFVRHMEVAYAAPGDMLVLRGELGPLLFMGVAGAMTVSFKQDGQGTKLSLRYTVGGHDPENFVDLATAVDAVLGEQVKSLTAKSSGATKSGAAP